ncbi:MAG: peptide/nickel transport system permease protein [Solirubrobacteraceae bacterium]|nr:peptide/nickel transport system permease protein [Solirubrobacteraceae bacterium]
MRKFVLMRLAGLVLVLLAMTLAIFLLRQVVPSDPARAAVGPNAPESVVKLKRQELGLDKPVYTQYFDYLGNVVHGDFGTSTRTLAPVSDDIRTYFPASLELMLAAMLIAAVLAGTLALGQTLLRRSGFLRVFLLAGASAPIFLVAELLLLFCWFKLGWLPGGGRTDLAGAPTGPTGLLTIDSVLAGRPDAFWDACIHLLLPAFTLALPMGVAVGRTLRSSLVGTLRQDYIRTARSKGLAEGSVLRRHALRNSATGALSMAGLQVGLLLANLLVVERIFAWPGLGAYTVESLGRSDLSAVLGVALVFGVIFIVTNTLVDLLQALADPRVALE